MSTLNFTPRVPVFDANVGIGHRHDRKSPCESPDQLLCEMGRHGVDRALVYPLQGEIISPIQGNDSLASWTDSNDALIPQYVAGCDPESLKQLADLHKDGKISSVRLHDLHLFRGSTATCSNGWAQKIYPSGYRWQTHHHLKSWTHCKTFRIFLLFWLVRTTYIH